METKKNGIIQSSLDEVLHNSMMPYAEHVILDRALPRVEDGLKPVQRRILYTMYEMGLTPDKPHRKCAKIVGDCLGKYHPHGDTSVYDALVRMAQDFNMRMPLVNGHGNFGTVDGDSAAAYRYTEARLEELALELLKDIDKETVDFALNFDDSLLEPTTLPGRYPNLLVNGASGIAVGLATNIPPHNLAEVIDGTVAFIDNPKITLKEMMKYIKGPDFPTGGTIIAGEELETAYRTGRGKIRVRAKVGVEKEGEKKNLIISELPYQVNKANLLKKIVDLKEEKKDLFSGIADVVDESDRNGMRAVVKLKKEADEKKTLALLYKYTDLESTFGINMVAIAAGKPRQMPLLDIIGYYVNYQREVILRRSKYDLDKAKERAHILEGLIIAVKNIDEVIKIIKKSANTSEARQNLRARFSLSEVQANAVLDLRLARLTKLEIEKLQEELAALKELISRLNAIIGSKKLQMDVVKEELAQIRRKYRDNRRTAIVGSENAMKVETSVQEKISKSYVVVYTVGGMFKKVPEKNYRMSDKAPETLPREDIAKLRLAAESENTFLVFTNLGNAFKIDLEIAPESRFRDKGYKFTEIAKDAAKGEYPVAFFTYGKLPEGMLLFFTKNGMVKKTSWAEYDIIKSAYQAIKLKEGDELAKVEEDKPETTLAFITKDGLCLNALKDDLPEQGRVAGGVKGINLNAGDEIVYLGQAEDSGEFITVTSGGCFKRVIAGDIEPMARYRKGVKIVSLDTERVVYGGFVQEPFTLAVLEESGAFSLSTEDISIESRTSKGKTLKNEHKKCRPVGAVELK